MSGSLKMTVNVSLCGSIPRSQMNFCSTKQLRELDMNSTNSRSQSDIRRNGCKTPCLKSPASRNINTCLPRKVSCDQIATSSAIAPSPPPIIEPPTWAVAAKGEARLEPVCESLNVQTAIDLTKQAVFRVGRSQNSDVQLLHCTSSRRHAILFHHPNGSCYVVDCGSAYGTYVNGVRVNTVMSSDQNNGSSGIILPHRVKKGSIIRFGGPGAPSFILKSFSVGIETLVENLKEANKTAVIRRNSLGLGSSDVRKDEADAESDAASEALITLNTRLNAIGSSLNSLSPKKLSSSLSSAHIHARLQTQTSNISFLKKRSIVSFDDSDSEPEVPPLKKRKTSFISQSSSYDDSDSSSVAIVSPLREKPTLKFNFECIDRPVVSPTPIENIAPLKICNGICLPSGCKKSILRTPLSLPCTKSKNRRVKFSDTPPEVYDPLAVSDDKSS